jgi:hypothetical protein
MAPRPSATMASIKSRVPIRRRRACRIAAASSPNSSSSTWSLGMSGGSNRLGITAFTVGCTSRAMRREPLHAYFPMSGAAAPHDALIAPASQAKGVHRRSLPLTWEQAAHRGRVRRQTDAQRRPIRSGRPSVERTFPPAPRRPLGFPTERAMDVVNVAWGVSPKRSRKRMSLCRHQAAVDAQRARRVQP